MLPGAASSSEQPFQIQRPGVHHNLAGRSTRPFASRPIAVQLHAVLVGVGQIKRLADAVIGRTLQGNTGALEPLKGIGKRGTRGIPDGHVVQPRASLGRRRSSPAFPRIQRDVMVVASGADECGARPIPRRQFEPEDVAIKRQGAIQIGNLEVNVPDINAGIDRGRLQFQISDFRFQILRLET
jgi:hypothetical protein